MIRRPPRSTRTDTLFPYTTLFRSEGDGLEGILGELEAHVLHLEEALVLLHQGVLRLRQDLNEGALVQILQGGHHRQAADELRDEAELQQILRLDILQDLARRAVLGAAHVGAEADRAALAQPGDQRRGGKEGVSTGRTRWSPYY